MTVLRIEALAAHNQLQEIDCGGDSLNRFLSRHVHTNQRANASRTYVALRGERAVGFHTLVVGAVAPEQAPERLSQGLAHHPVPLMVLARLAVNCSDQDQGLGAGLLKDVIQRTLAAADIAGIRALAVHAKDEAASSFCSHFGFVPSPTAPLHLLALLKDLRGLS